MSNSVPLVLVADDEPSMLELVARHLETMGSPKFEQILKASDGEEAWRTAQEKLPDLVVLDVMMPGMSGWEVCKKIREAVALDHTSVVMLTGIGETLNSLTSPLYGADAYIDKPFEFDDFDDKVRAALEARKAQREAVQRPSVNGAHGLAQAADSSRDLLDEDESGPGLHKAARRGPGKGAASRAAAKVATKVVKKVAKQVARAVKAVAAAVTPAKAKKKGAAKKKAAPAKPAKAVKAVKKAAKKVAKKVAARKPAAAKPAAKKPLAKKASAKKAVKKVAAKAVKAVKKKATAKSKRR